MIVELAVNDLVAGLDNGIGLIFLQSEVQVGLGSALFEQAEGFNDWDWHTLTLTSNLEVLE